MTDPLHRAEPTAGTLSAVVEPPPPAPAGWPGRILLAAGLLGMVLALALGGMNLRAQGELRTALAEVALHHAAWREAQADAARAGPEAAGPAAARADVARQAMVDRLAQASLARIGVDTVDRRGLLELESLARVLGQVAPPVRPAAAAAPDPGDAASAPASGDPADPAPAAASDATAAPSPAAASAPPEPSAAGASGPVAEPDSPPATPPASAAPAGDPASTAGSKAGARPDGRGAPDFAARLALEQARAQRQAWGPPEPMVAFALALMLVVTGRVARATRAQPAPPPMPHAPAVPPPPFDAPLRAAARGVVDAHATRDQLERLRHAQDDAALARCRDDCEALLGQLGSLQQRVQELDQPDPALARVRLGIDGLAEMAQAVEDAAARLRDRAVGQPAAVLAEHEALLASARTLIAVLPRLQAAADGVGPAGLGRAAASLGEALAQAAAQARQLQEGLSCGPSHAEVVAQDELQARVSVLALALDQADPGRKEPDGLVL